MSGGSYDYSYRHVEEFAASLRLKDNGKRAALKKVLALVANAMHDVEWVDSGDYGTGDEDKAIDLLLKGVGLDPELERKAAAYDEMAKWLGGGK